MNDQNFDFQALLARVRIVMIGTTLPANIGSAARALHTMGLADLVVVSPRLPIDDTSIANAAGAGDILAKTRIVDDLAAAIDDCSLVFAASARSRQMPRAVVTPNLAAQLMQQHLMANFTKNSADDLANNLTDNLTDNLTNHSDFTDYDTHQIAILFGREDRGLTNEELAAAHYHIQIPANPAYPVLNVASAIQVIAASIYATFSGAHDTDSPSLLESFNTKQLQGAASEAHILTTHIRSHWDAPAISHAQADSLEVAMIALMTKLNLARDDDLGLLPARLSRLNARVQLDQKEYALIRALLARIQSTLAKLDKLEQAEKLP